MRDSAGAFVGTVQATDIDSSSTPFGQQAYGFWNPGTQRVHRDQLRRPLCHRRRHRPDQDRGRAQLRDDDRARLLLGRSARQQWRRAIFPGPDADLDRSPRPQRAEQPAGKLRDERQRERRRRHRRRNGRGDRSRPGVHGQRPAALLFLQCGRREQRLVGLALFDRCSDRSDQDQRRSQLRGRQHERRLHGGRSRQAGRGGDRGHLPRLVRGARAPGDRPQVRRRPCRPAARHQLGV